MTDDSLSSFPSPSPAAVDLSTLDDDYGKAQAEPREQDPVPDGRYQVNVEKVELTRARTSGNALLRWQLKILSGPLAGRFLFKNSVIASADNLKFLKTDLVLCGLELEKLSDLPNRLEELLDVKLDVTRRTKGENSNIYLNRRIVLADDRPAAGPDDTTPF
jgi:hypothetical protein